MFLLRYLKVSFFLLFIGGSSLFASLTTDTVVTYYTARGGDPSGTTGDPNQPGGLSDTGNTPFGSYKSTLFVVDEDTYKITMDTDIPKSITFLIEGVDWGNMGIISTVTVTNPPLEEASIYRTDTRFAVRTTQALTAGSMVTIDVTGVHVPEPQTYILLGSIMGINMLLYRCCMRRKIGAT